MICGGWTRYPCLAAPRTRILPCRRPPPRYAFRAPNKKANRLAIRPVCRASGTGYFLSGVCWLNGKVPNMFLAWLCICSCICTNRFLLCSM